MSLDHSAASLALGLTFFTAALGAQKAPVSAPISSVRYDVTADKAALLARQLRVTTSFDVAGADDVLLSLPAWTPGAYEISDFAKWVSGFRAMQDGAAVRWDKLDYDTWRVHPAHAGRVSVTFEYAADTLDNAMSWTRPDFALFNGTNLFLYPEGRTMDFPSTVVVITEPDFLIATGLTPSQTRGTFTATNYHDLVDNPFFVGRFAIDSATVSGRTVRYATYPVGSVTKDVRASAWELFKRAIPVEAAVFGEAPWETYTVMQIADSAYQGSSGLEHSSSHVDIVGDASDMNELQSLYAHEIFHSWNVKRLRPADLMPYRYDRPQPTTWLWMSEGITDYYADLAVVRAGIVDEAGFFALTARKIGEIASTIPFALEDASLNTWIHPHDGTAYSYYPKGSLAGLMLDITIRDASDNRHSLDQVLRSLYDSTYKQGRGFTHDEFWGAVRRAAAGGTMEEFERKYVDGRDAYPWQAMLRMAGMRLVPDSTPRIGVTTAADSGGAIRVVRVDTGTTAASAGVAVGDAMVSVGDIPVVDPDFGAKFRLRYAGRPSGSSLTMVVKRGGQAVTLRGVLAYATTTPRITEDPAAGARAIRVRNGILRGTVDR